MLSQASAALCLLGSAWSASGAVIDDFEGASSPAPWAFSNGVEYPGATGALSRGTGYTGAGAHLAYDTSAGGNYVAAIDTLATPVSATCLRLWVKSPGGVRVQLRVNDASGQTLQYSPTRPFEAGDAQRWYQLTVDLAPTSDHWGGSVNDGKLHGLVTSISVMAQPGTTKTGAIDFDHVELIDAPATLVHPEDTPAAAPAVTDFNGSLGVEMAHPDLTAAGLALVQSLGFQHVRTELFWTDVETKAGVYNFSWYDTLVAHLKTRGVTPLFILCYGNPLYTGTYWMSPPLTPTAIAAFGKFAQAAAAHFAGQGVRFEVWNEPDLAGFWKPPSAAAYRALSRVAIGRVHTGDPSARVATGGLAGIDLAFLDAMAANGGAAGTNAVGFHPYRMANPESLASDLLDLRGHLKKAFPASTPALWSTEAGYSSAWYGDGSLAANRTTQAKFSARQMLTGLALGLPAQNFFALRDAGSNVRDSEHNFGIVDANYKAKPLTAAVRTLLAQCSGRTFVGVLAAPQSTTHVLKFKNQTDTLLVLWSENTVGKQTITFPGRPQNVVDYKGDAIAPVAADPNLFAIEVDDAPVYALFPNAPKVQDKLKATARPAMGSVRRLDQ